MSLINEALKKAQRDRHLESLPPIPGGGGRPGRRGRGMSTQTMVLIGAAGVSLFVVAVVGAVLLINREPPPKSAVVVVKATPKPTNEPAAANSPLIVLPVQTKPSPTPSVVAPALTATPPPATPPPASTPAREPPAPIAITLAPALPAPTRPPESASDKFDERLQALVDSWKVTAVRNSGNESKLFMNGSVYRVDDVIDRSSRLRLTKVTPTALTFTDANGIDYVKRY